MLKGALRSQVIDPLLSALLAGFGFVPLSLLHNRLEEVIDAAACLGSRKR